MNYNIYKGLYFLFSTTLGKAQCHLRLVLSIQRFSKKYKYILIKSQQNISLKVSLGIHDRQLVISKHAIGEYLKALQTGVHTLF